MLKFLLHCFFWKPREFLKASCNTFDGRRQTTECAIFCTPANCLFLLWNTWTHTWTHEVSFYWIKAIVHYGHYCPLRMVAVLQGVRQRCFISPTTRSFQLGLPETKPVTFRMPNRLFTSEPHPPLPLLFRSHSSMHKLLSWCRRASNEGVQSCCPWKSHNNKTNYIWRISTWRDDFPEFLLHLHLPRQILVSRLFLEMTYLQRLHGLLLLWLQRCLKLLQVMRLKRSSGGTSLLEIKATSPKLSKTDCLPLY